MRLHSLTHLSAAANAAAVLQHRLTRAFMVFASVRELGVHAVATVRACRDRACMSIRGGMVCAHAGS
jgi:hypothetical protein